MQFICGYSLSLNRWGCFLWSKGSYSFGPRVPLRHQTRKQKASHQPAAIYRVAMRQLAVLVWIICFGTIIVRPFQPTQL